LLDGPACAVELIHAYSLVHDDLPAMDDDDLRRGQPTVHRAYDEATAILVGDALQTLAFAQLARAEAGERQSALLHALSEGAMDMVRGQALDLSLVGTDGHRHPANPARAENRRPDPCGRTARRAVRELPRGPTP
jgi:geranylgeranyl pyrophosphate synthase